MKRNIFYCINIFFLILAHPSNLSGIEERQSGTVSILFIGNSYFEHNDLPEMFRAIAEKAGKSVIVSQYVSSGTKLQMHAENPEVDAIINSRYWDFVVLQGSAMEIAYPDSFTTYAVYPALQTLKEKILNKSELTSIMYFMSWAYEDGMTWYEEWTDNYSEMQLKIYENTLQYAEELDLIVAPAGWAWNHVLEERGNKPHYLHIDDWTHANVKGSYLAAQVIYSSIFQEEIEEDYYVSGITIDEERYFREIASEMVLNDLVLWRIPPFGQAVSLANRRNLPVLEQNYPNPYSSNTIIPYTVEYKGIIEIFIYNQLGMKVCSALHRKVSPGQYKLNFDGSKLAEGIYFYSIKGGGAADTYKMMIIR